MGICGICGRLFYARSFCVFCEFRGRTLRSLTICVHLCASVGGSSMPKVSVCSVNSVGGLQCWCTSARLVQRRPCTPWEGGVGMAGMPYPPKCALWEDTPWGKKQRGHGGMPCPLTLVMWMRGYGKDAIPSYDYLTSTFLTLPSAVRTMFRPFWSLLSLTPLTVKNSTSPSATVVALMPVSGSLGAVQSLSTTLT